MWLGKKREEKCPWFNTSRASRVSVAEKVK